MRHARWGDLTEAETAAGAAELREVADDRGDLLAQVAGLALGTAEGNGAEYEARRQVVALGNPRQVVPCSRQTTVRRRNACEPEGS